MINEYCAKKYCREDISLIENYAQAVEDTTKTWDLHHRRETDENKSARQLIDDGLYCDRPADELIFLTHREHIRLHLQGKQFSEKHR